MNESHPLSILIIDDEKRILETFSRHLSPGGYKVITAMGGEEGIRAYEEERPDIVFTDMRMPPPDGLEVLHKIKEINPDAEVIIVTGHGEVDIAIEALRGNASGFLTKPVEISMLDAVMQLAQERLRLKRALHRTGEESRANEEYYRREAEVNAAMTELSKMLITSSSIDDISYLVLEHARRLTNSKYGYVGYIEPKTGHLISPTLTRDIWDSCGIREKSFEFDGFTGLFGWVLSNKESIITNSPSEDPRSTGVPSGHVPIERFISAPAVIDGELVGQVALANSDRDYAETDMSVVEQLASLYALAIQRSRGEDSLRRYADEQAALYAVASAVAASLETEELFSNVFDAVLPILRANAGWVTIPDATLEECTGIAAWRGVPEEFIKAEESTHLATCPVCSAMMNSNADTIVPALVKDCPRIPGDILERTGLYGHVGIPLAAGSKIIGILNIGWHNEVDFLPQEKQDLLLSIGRQVGVTLHNARLYRAARQVDRLSVLNELDQAISATLDPETVAGVTLYHVTNALNTPNSALILRPRQRGEHYKVLLMDGIWVNLNPKGSDEERFNNFIREVIEQGENTPPSAGELSGMITAPHSGKSMKWDDKDMVLPVWSDRDMVAILLLGGRPRNLPFTDEDGALAQSAAARAGQAMQNAWLYRASRKKSERLSILNTIGAAAASSLEPDIVLRQILEMACYAVDAEGGSILLRNLSDNRLNFVLALKEDAGMLLGQYLEPGQGIAGWVMLNRQAALVNDTQNDGRFYDGVDRATGFKTRSILCVPLLHRENVIGVIEIVNKYEGHFTEDDLSLLEAVSSIAAAAIENARLYETARTRADELTMLNKIGLAITSKLDYPEVVRSALSHVQRIFHAEHVSLLMPDPRTKELFFVQSLADTIPVDIPVRLSPGEGIAGWAMENRKPVLVEDAQDDPRFSPRVDQQLGGNTRALIAVPLVTAEQTIGVIEVVSQEPGVYTMDNLQTLQALSATLAVALDNARLYDELKTLLREREQAQAQLIHSEKMGALGRLTASIAHEINNPLQSVQGCLTLIGDELDGERRHDKLDRYLEIVDDEINRISTIVHRMRDFYRPAREGLEMVHVHDVLENVLALTYKQLQHSGVTVEQNWAEDLPEIRANTSHLKQVFLNLVLNAIDAMPGGGTLTISTGESRIQSDDNSQTLPAVCIEFFDTGEGVPPDMLSHLFEPFFTTKDHGSGLGLSVTYGIIESHKGQITASSRVGAGTVFTILLPVGQEET